MATRRFSSISVETTLASGIGATGTTITVATGTGAGLINGAGFVNGDQFTVAIDPDTTSEEIVFITAASGDSFTITRGQAGTTAITHGSGATVKHVLTSSDLNWFESNTSPLDSIEFTGSSSGTTTVQASAVASGTLTLPAATDTLVGKATTDTLTNKTLTSPTINTPTLTLSTTTSTTDGRVAWDATNDKIVVGDGSATKEFTANTITLNAQTNTTYTLVLADRDKLVTLSNASAITLTVPTNASVAFATGTQVNIQQIGAGQVTVAGDTGVTVNGTGTKTRAQWSAATLLKTATDTWTLIGDLE